jgi:hypothetical protein
MLCVALESTIPAFELAKAVHVLDSEAPVAGTTPCNPVKLTAASEEQLCLRSASCWFLAGLNLRP